MMEIKEAIRILHPDTTAEALAEYDYYNGCNGKEVKKKAVDEACKIACEVMEKAIPKKVWDTGDKFICRNCCQIFAYKHVGLCIECLKDRLYCPSCGQAQDWSEMD